MSNSTCTCEMCGCTTVVEASPAIAFAALNARADDTPTAPSGDDEITIPCPDTANLDRS